MKFTTITPQAFRTFAAKSPYNSFRQTTEAAAYRAQEGWQAFYFGVKADNGRLLAAAMLVAKPTFLGYQTFYCLGGPLLDLEDTELTTFFFTHLKSFLKEQHAYVLQIVPYYPLIERDRDGRIVQGGFNHQKALTNLQNLGFRPVPDSLQQRYLYVLDLAGRSEDEVLASFSQNVRRSLRRAEKHDVRIREAKREDLPLFKEITADTAHRRHFADQTSTYYERMYDLFVPSGKALFLLAEIEDPAAPKNPNKTRTKPEQPPTQPADSTSPPPFRHPLPISAAMFVMPYASEVCYLFSGSPRQYMKDYCAQYLMQWYMIKYAISHGFPSYNFEGLCGLPDPDSPDYARYKASPEYGIFTFKRGFGGHVVELIGTFELPIHPLIYRLHACVSKLIHLFRHD